jgi:peptide/nickel transport system substrate-binding protein
MVESEDGGAGALSYELSRRTLLKGAVGGSMLIALPALLAACTTSSKSNGNKSQGTRPQTSSVIGGIGYNVSTPWDPALSTDIVTGCVNYHLHEGLLTINPATRAISPGLATVMPSLAGSKLTIAMRDAKFHDGTSVTADDVVFSFTRIIDPKLNSYLLGYFPFLDDVTAVDSHTVQLQFKYPVTSDVLESRLAIVGIVPRAALAGDGKAFQAKPIGCGPYRFESFSQNNYVKINAFEGYTGNRTDGPNDVTFRMMVDGSSRVAALAGKQVQVIDDVPYQDLPTLKKTSGIKTSSIQSTACTIMLMNCAKKPFTDKRVRQAFMYAIDRDSITKDVFQGNCSVATSILPDQHPDYSRPSTVYTYDPDRAKQLLAGAGYPDGVSMTLFVNQEDFIEPQGAIIQSGAAKAGFHVTLQTAQTSKLFENVVAGTFDAAITAFDGSISGADDADSLIRYLWAGALPSQWMRWEDAASKQVAKLLDDALQSSSQSVAKQDWATVQDIVADEAPVLPVHFKYQETGYESSSIPWYLPMPSPGMYVAGEHS